ncbi:hypothetical protein J1605_005015 [Eschrichtius robustus]|uniref:14-3-3 domain-containing protein n=1 Tax=Eschrichtius robustus TaxID=9764 RepID=A0AB34H8L9_ESCRO|nr:hypothetical protein J1605_005015 [Eschrichtius robustus]
MFKPERNLLSLAYTNVVRGRRSAWRIILNIQQETYTSDQKLQLIKDYRETVESELRSIRATVLDLLDRHLIAIAPNPESKIFYLTMKGDYFRCLAEETLNNPELACTLAKMAFDVVTEELDTLNEEEACKDSAFNMQFLRDNFMDIRQCRRRM